MKIFICNRAILCSRKYISLTSAGKFHSGVSLRRERYLSDAEGYQVLHHSNIPTMYFQKSLLRLPIPDLEKTCSRYLRSQRVILSDQEYEETKKIVENFGSESGVGTKLQKQLKNKDQENKHTSYISGPWFDMYLSDRVPVVLNYNPFLTFLPEERKGYSDPVIRTSNILVSSMRFMNTLKKGILEPEVYHLDPSKSDTPLFRRIVKWTPTAFASYAAYAFKAFPLDMSQFKNLFHSTRIPQRGKDAIHDFPDAKHILMMKNGNFYVFDLYDRDGNLVSPSQILACVAYVYQDQSPPPEFPVGILTSENRDTWASLRRDLLHADNRESLNLIDSAAFNIVLDDVTVGVDPVTCFRNFLYGNGANRWFDKSFSLIVTADGMVALNFEHAWGDGVAVMRYFNEVAKETAQSPIIERNTKVPDIDAAKLVRKLGLASQARKIKERGFGILHGKLACLKTGINPNRESRITYPCMMALGLDISYKIDYRGYLVKFPADILEDVPWKKLNPPEFNIPNRVKNGIKDALASYEERTKTLMVDVYESDVMGKNFCKKHKVSPDAMMQLGFQVAYYLQNGVSVASYESCSTSAFKHGRTETLRPATLETASFAKAVALAGEKASGSELKQMIYECSKMHGQLTKEAAMGQGFDRHLFGLRKIAENRGGPMPAIFTDSSYAKINHNVISTSTLPSPYIIFGGFAPVVPDGFGVGYQIQDEKLGIVLSSYPSLRKGAEFVECADKAYKIIHDILSKS